MPPYHEKFERIIGPDVDPVQIREANALKWLFSSEAGPLTVCEARHIIRERFGADVDEAIRQKYSR